MTTEQWRTGRDQAGLTQVEAARALKVSQLYLSQLEKGLRAGSAGLSHKAAKLYKLPPTVLPVSQGVKATPDTVQKELGSLGYPGFEHVRSRAACNPAEAVLHAVLNRDLDTRLVEALPWVLGTYPDLRWDWLRDRAKLHNAQNRLGYLVYMARRTASANAAQALSKWEAELEEARLAGEGTLCRDSMPEREREWVRTNRPALPRIGTC